jgi:hypothetical protein
LGPRARRRVVGIAVGVAAIAAVAAGVLSMQSSHHPPGATTARFIYANRNLEFGMTRPQVRRISGPPTATRGNCWLFRPRRGMVGSISMGDPGSIAARSTGDLKLCFYANAFASAFRHISVDGRWKWIAWTPVLTIVAAPAPS